MSDELDGPATRYRRIKQKNAAGEAIPRRDITWLLAELERKWRANEAMDDKWNDLRRAVTEFEDMFPNRKYPAWLQVLRKKVGPR